ncbi:hypothetical protein TIFTF001_050633 [Ficus carica]|uniref:Uncharacterized protein n=1 Tax=Ficus carica TaxID=3494 RepID=A0AA88CTS3_FICCA|nr:hypothetical protein TIFTF001_050633 [Ficus carica]
MLGSFYGRLFPTISMHIIHSSYSLHWLSRVPKGLVGEIGESLNIGSIYISSSSPSVVYKAYLDQFQEDFTLFLRSRSEEIAVSGGSMYLTVTGRIDNPNIIFKGKIEKTKLDYFNLLYYAPNASEVEKVIEEEGSFTLQKLDVFQIERDAGFSELYRNKAQISMLPLTTLK